MKLIQVTACCFADEQPDGSFILKLHMANVPKSQIVQLAAWMEAVFMANTRGSIELPPAPDQEPPLH